MAELRAKRGYYVFEVVRAWSPRFELHYEVVFGRRNQYLWIDDFFPKATEKIQNENSSGGLKGTRTIP